MYLQYVKILDPKAQARDIVGLAIGTVLKLIGMLSALSGVSFEKRHTHPDPHLRVSAAEDLMIAEAMRFASPDGLLAASLGPLELDHMPGWRSRRRVG